MASVHPSDDAPLPATASPSERITTLEIGTTAETTIAFDKAVLEAPAGDSVTVAYTNDANVPHNIAFFDSEDASGTVIAQSETITGPGARTEVTFVAPDTPGDYLFRCQLHPMQMVGTLTVTP
jgi:plastocyanin